MSGGVHIRFGERLVVRFSRAARLVVGLQSKRDAEGFLKDLKERLAGFGLELHPEKTQLGSSDRSRPRTGSDAGRPETFDFRGLTYYVTKPNRSG